MELSEGGGSCTALGLVTLIAHIALVVLATDSGLYNSGIRWTCG